MPEPLLIDPRAQVFAGAGSGCSGAAFAAAVDRLAAELPEARPGSQIAFAFEHDLLAFAVALFACWRRGHCAAIPVNARRHAVAHVMQEPATCAFLHDTGAGTGIHVPSRLAATGPEPVPEQPCALPLGTLRHYEFDGVVPRVTNHGADALAAATAGAAAAMRLGPRTRIANLFRPAFVPSLAHGLLAPLLAGSPLVWFVGGQEQARPARPDLAVAEVWLAPTAWWRTAAREPSAGRWPRRICTCDEPLDPPTCERLIERGADFEHGSSLEPPRRQSPGAAAALQACWHVGATDAAVVELTPPGEAEARRFVLAAGGTVTAGALAAALAPSGAGRDVCGVLPELPRDSDGRLAIGDLLRLLGRLPDGGSPVHELRWQWQVDRDAHYGTTTVPPDYYAFDGHFTGYPLLNGAVQLHDLVLPALRTAHGPDAVVLEFLDLKFQARIGPNAALTVALRTLAPGLAEFTIERAGGRCTSGRLRFQAASGAMP